MSTHANITSKLVKKIIVLIISTTIIIELFQTVFQTSEQTYSDNFNRHQRHSSAISFTHNYSEFGLTGSKLQKKRNLQLDQVCDLYFQKYPEQLVHKNFHHAVQLLDEAPDITRREIKSVDLKEFGESMITTNSTEKSKNNVKPTLKFDKSVMCIPPKTGTTNWQFVSIALQWGRSIKETRAKLAQLPVQRTYDTIKSYTVLLEELGSSQETQEILDQKLSDYSLDLFGEKSEGPVRVINARHPFARLYSIWKEKCSLKISAAYCEKSKILDRDLVYSKIKSTHVVSFYGFIQFVLYNHKLGNGYERHWAPIMMICQPCFVNYEFVAKLESVDSDYEYFLKKIGLSLDVLGNFPSAYESTAMDYNNYVDRLVTFFNIFSKEDMELLCEIYSVLDNLSRQM